MNAILKATRPLPTGLLTAIVVAIIAQVYLDLKIPLYMAEITDSLQNGEATSGALLRIGADMVFVVLGSFVCSCVAGILTARLALTTTLRLRLKVFETVERFALRELSQFTAAGLVTRTTNDLTQIQWFVARALQAGIKSPILAVWSIRRIVDMNCHWSLAIAVTVAYMLAVAWIVARFAMPRFYAIQTYLDDFNRIVRETLVGLRTVRAFSADDYQLEKFERVNKTTSHTDLVANRIFAIQNPGVNLAVNGTTLAVYWIAAALMNSVSTGREKIFSDAIVVSSYGLQTISAFLLLAIVIVLIPQFMVSARRVSEVLTTESSIQDALNERANVDADIRCKREEIRFENASFRFSEDSDDILKDVSLTIRPGETIGVVGNIGSGKTTFLRLLLRFCDATNGNVFLGDQNVKEIPLCKLRERFAYVPQKPALFQGSILYNIALTEPENIDRERAIEAGRLAQCEGFVSNLSKGWDDLVAQDGSNFSGGQKQRLSIARALYRNAPINLFDDSFSALDGKTEKTLRTRLKEERPDATFIFVSQKVSSLRDADRILVLNEGRLAGFADRETLMKECDVFRAIVASQMESGNVPTAKGGDDEK